MRRLRCPFVLFLLSWCAVSQAGDPDRGGWQSWSPRDEISPQFRCDQSGTERESLVIQADERSGLSGAWVRNNPVTGGKWYRFEVRRQTEGIVLPRRAAIVRLIWLDANGENVLRKEPVSTSYRAGQRPRAEPEFPAVTSTSGASDLLSGQYQAPEDAVVARLELHFRWGAPNSKVTWSAASLNEIEPPAPRPIRLATIHYQPREGTEAREKCEQFAPLISEAIERGADLIVLPETLTYYASKKSFSDVAEPVPGPSTEYFGELSKQHDCYLVAGLVEREGHLIYNVAVLLGPEGELVGKYRKTTLPRSEIEAGLTPGDTYPVFDTRFGKLGMMICYDGFFPEVARELTNGGAEVIAWPVWGCNPMLAAARACENHVYVVSSTYSASDRQWMRSAIYGHDGQMLSAAEEFGTIAMAEVDLNRPTYWHSLGDFQAQIQAHRPKVRDPLP